MRPAGRCRSTPLPSKGRSEVAEHHPEQLRVVILAELVDRAGGIGALGVGVAVGEARLDRALVIVSESPGQRPVQLPPPPAPGPQLAKTAGAGSRRSRLFARWRVGRHGLPGDVRDPIAAGRAEIGDRHRLAADPGFLCDPPGERLGAVEPPRALGFRLPGRQASRSITGIVCTAGSSSASRMSIVRDFRPCGRAPGQAAPPSPAAARAAVAARASSRAPDLAPLPGFRARRTPPPGQRSGAARSDAPSPDCSSGSCTPAGRDRCGCSAGRSRERLLGARAAREDGGDRLTAHRAEPQVLGLAGVLRDVGAEPVAGAKVGLDQVAAPGAARRAIDQLVDRDPAVRCRDDPPRPRGALPPALGSGRWRAGSASLPRWRTWSRSSRSGTAWSGPPRRPRGRRNPREARAPRRGAKPLAGGPGGAKLAALPSPGGERSAAPPGTPRVWDASAPSPFPASLQGF